MNATPTNLAPETLDIPAELRRPIADGKTYAGDECFVQTEAEVGKEVLAQEKGLDRKATKH